MVRTMLKVVAHCHSLGVIHRCAYAAGALPCASHGGSTCTASVLAALGLSVCCILCRPDSHVGPSSCICQQRGCSLVPQAFLSSISASWGGEATVVAGHVLLRPTPGLSFLGVWGISTLPWQAMSSSALPLPVSEPMSRSARRALFACQSLLGARAPVPFPTNSNCSWALQGPQA